MTTDTKLSLQQAAKTAGVGTRKITEWCDRYGIGHKIGGRWYISADKLGDLLDNGEPQPDVPQPEAPLLEWPEVDAMAEWALNLDETFEGLLSQIRPTDDGNMLSMPGITPSQPSMLNVTQVEALIMALAIGRAGMNPPLPEIWPVGEKFYATPDPAYRIEDDADGTIALHILSNFAGWVHFTCSPERARDIGYALLHLAEAHSRENNTSH